MEIKNFTANDGASLHDEIEEIKILMGSNPHGSKSLLDALIEKCSTMDDLKLKAEMYHLKGLAFEKTQQYNRAIEWYSKALPLRREGRDQKGEAITLNNLGLMFLNTGKYADAIIYLRLAIEIKKELDDYKSYTATCENLGGAFQKISDFKRAIEMHYESLKISEKHNDFKRMVTSYQNIGMVHYAQNDYEYALKMFHKALQLGNDSIDKIQILQVNNNIGHALIKLKKYQESVDYFSLCLAMSTEIDYKPGIAVSNNNLGEVYMEKGDYPNALSCYEKCNNIAKDHNDLPDQIQASINLGQVYLLLNEFSKSEDILNWSLGQSIETQEIESQQRIYLLLSQLYEKQGQIDKAYENFKKHDELKGKVLNIENTRVINELKTIHEVDKKEKENEISRLRNIELKDALEELTIEKRKSEKLLLNILPEEIAYEMKRYGKVKARYFESVSVMFLDVIDFTHISEQLSPDELVLLLDTYISRFDEIMGKYDVEKIKTIGDGYLCVAGLPNRQPDHAYRQDWRYGIG
jgi:adenylate cyclase